MTTEEVMALLDRVKALVEVVDDGANPDGSDVHDVAERVVSGLPRGELDVMAAWWLADEVRAERRARTYRAERAAERAVPVVPKPRKVNPRKLSPKRYAEWVKSTEEGREYDERRRRWEEEDRESDERFRAELRAIQQRYAAELRMEWTEELLSSGFALPNGEVVTWGEATVAEHRQRAAMFEANAEGNLRGAARHRHAVETLESAGVSCLQELVSMDADAS
jgi:hypothetical protein